MKFLIAAFVLVAAVQASDDWTKLTWVHREMPTNPRYTWKEWQQIMANQQEQPEDNVIYTGTEPQPEDAGFPKVEHKGRIIGGSPATRGQFPWQAALRLDSSSFCGGSLIGSSWVLTAAHCTVSISTFTVTLGATLISSSQDGSVTQTTRNKITHKDYNSYTLNNDIALLRLNTPVSGSQYISTVRLPSSSDVGNSFAGSDVIISGWGKTSGSGGISSQLNYVQLTVTPNTNCAKYFGNVINSSKICTTGVNGKSPCNGDSGGPLVYRKADGSYIEVGVVSFGSNGCLASYPAVFTRVTSYLSWISSNTGLAIQ